MNELKKRLPLQCPACESPLRVGRMFCGECGTEVCGDFELPLLYSFVRERTAVYSCFCKVER